MPPRHPLALAALALAALAALASARRLAAAAAADLPPPTVPLASLCALSKQYAVSLKACQDATSAHLDAGVDWEAVSAAADRAAARGGRFPCLSR